MAGSRSQIARPLTCGTKTKLKLPRETYYGHSRRDTLPDCPKILDFGSYPTPIFSTRCTKGKFCNIAQARKNASPRVLHKSGAKYPHEKPQSKASAAIPFFSIPICDNVLYHIVGNLLNCPHEPACHFVFTTYLADPHRRRR